MPEDRPTISSSRLSATEVARHTFGTVRRGFDPTEVRAYLELVARDMQTWEQREHDLRSEIAEIAERARHPVLDEATLTAALGQQSAQLLRHAHQEAARVTGEADERAVAVLRSAQADASEIMVRAEAAAGERIAEAELAVNSVREQAESEKRSIIETARNDGEELVGRAREHGRHVVEEAQAARRRVLADLAQRRKGLHGQIEQLRAARDQLATSVLGVRDMVDDIAQALTQADQQAREAAAEAARRTDSEVLPVSGDVLIEVDTEGGVDAGVDADAALASDVPSGIPEELLVTAQVMLEPADAVPEGVEPPKSPEVPSVPEVAEGPGVAGAAGVTSVPEVAPEPEAAEVPEVAPEGPSGAPAATPAGHLGEAGHVGEAESIDSRSLEELFARIRASQVQDSAPGPGAEAGAGAGAGAKAALSDPGDRGTVVAGDTVVTGDAKGEEILQRRDELLAPIVSQLARRLKRALADDQNQLLDRLRATNGSWPPDVLAAEEDHAAEIAAAVLEPLREAAQAGRALLPEVSGRPTASVPMEGLAEELGLTVVRRLRRRLPGGEDGPAVEDVDDATEIVGAAYRSWRGQRVETLAEDFAVAAVGDAVVATAGSVIPLQWVVGSDHPPCADCEDNSLAGTVPAGEEYPTGHVRPPAHPGCRCMVAPAGAATR